MTETEGRKQATQRLIDMGATPESKYADGTTYEWRLPDGRIGRLSFTPSAKGFEQARQGAALNDLDIRVVQLHLRGNSFVTLVGEA